MPHKDPIVRKAYLKQWRKDNEKYVKQFDKKRWADNPKRRNAQKKYYVENSSKMMETQRKTHYGMFPEEYEARIKKQKNRCALCGLSEQMINYRTGKRQALSVDHNHKTKKNRDLLCQMCNRGIGFFGEDINLLRKVIQYLKKYEE